MSTVFLLRLIAYTLISLYSKLPISTCQKSNSSYRLKKASYFTKQLLANKFFKSYRNRPLDRQIDRIVNKEIPTTY